MTIEEVKRKACSLILWASASGSAASEHLSSDVGPVAGTKTLLDTKNVAALVDLPKDLKIR